MKLFDALFEAALVIPSVFIVGMIVVSLVMAAFGSHGGTEAAPGADFKHAA